MTRSLSVPRSPPCALVVLGAAFAFSACDDHGHDHPHAEGTAEHSHVAGGHGHEHAAAPDHAHAAAPEHAHEGENGHGHGHDEGGLPGSTVTHFARSAQDDTETELFVEFGPLIVGEETPFAAHFTDCGELWTAVDSGQLVVELGGEGQGSETFSVEGPSVPGIFRPVAKPQGAGQRRLRFVLARGTRLHVHDLGEVTVFPDKATAEKALAAKADEPVDDGAISFLKEQAWKLDFSLSQVKKRPLPETLRVFGTLSPPSGGEARVSAPASGTLVAPKGGLKPIGSRVERGETLAYLVPSIGGGGNLAAVLLRKEKAALQAAHAERELTRLQGLLEHGAVAARRVDEAGSELSRARAELQSADGLLAQHQGAVTGGSSAGGVKVIAPIDGVITALPVVAGAFVEEGGAIAAVVDTSVLLLTARVPEGERARAAKVFGGAFRIGTGAWHTIPASESGYELAPVLDDSDRSYPVRVPLENEHGALPAGAHVTADLAISAPQRTLAVDKRAVVFEQGMPVVYVMREGESFERVVVQLGAEHGGQVEIKHGLVEGERVASVGAIYLKLASRGGGAPAHGHPH